MKPTPSAMRTGERAIQDRKDLLARQRGLGDEAPKPPTPSAQELMDRVLIDDFLITMKFRNVCEVAGAVRPSGVTVISTAKVGALLRLIDRRKDW